MTLDEFRDKYCGTCGSQRCLASDEDIAECGYNPDSKDPLEDVLKAVKGGMAMDRLTDYCDGYAHGRAGRTEEIALKSNWFRRGTMECTAIIERLAQYEDTGLTPEQVAELAEKARDGRLVVLPCKVGTRVWVIGQNCDLCRDMYAEEPCLFGSCEYKEVFESVFGYGMIDNFGKTVFLTRAEAEVALKGAGHE